MTCAQSREFMEAFLPLIADTPDDRDLVLAPPFTALSTMAELSQNSRVCLSSQNVHWEGQGAFTGEISPAMLKEHGVCLLYTSPSPRDVEESRMPSSA